MARTITPTNRIAVSHQHALGVANHDLKELYSPDTAFWKSKVLDLGSPKYPPQAATAPTRYWFDRSRYQNHGAITGAVWKQLPSGVWVLGFDGIDDNVNLGNNLNVTTGDFSLGVVFNRDVAGVGQRLISKRSGTVGYELYAHGTNILNFFIGDAGGYTNITPNGYSLAAGVWYFGVVTCDRDGLARFYLNGVYKTAGSIALRTGSISNAANYTIAVPVASENFPGKIGDIFQWDVVLSASQVTQLWEAIKWRYS